MIRCCHTYFSFSDKLAHLLRCITYIFYDVCVSLYVINIQDKDNHISDKLINAKKVTRF